MLQSDSELPGDSKAKKPIEKWLREARKGSTEALGRLAEACRNYLLSIANAEISPALRTKMAGSDLVQLTLLEACRDFDRFSGDREEELLVWLRTILMNNLSNLHRRYCQTEKRQLAREVSLESTSPDELRPLHESKPDSSPPGKVIADEERQLVELLVSRLPEPLREAIALRHVRGLTFPEMATAMGRTEEAVRKLWTRAIRRLQEEIRRSRE